MNNEANDPTPVAPSAGRTSHLAIASFVLGLGALCTTVVTGLPAIALGWVSLSRIRRSGGQLKGRGLAITGIALGALSVVGLLTGLVLWQKLESHRRLVATYQLKRMSLGLRNYHDAFRGFPPQAIADPQGKPLLSWRVAILPFCEESALHKEFHLDEPWDSPHNLTLLERMPEDYRSPWEHDPRSTKTRYVALVGPGTVFPGGGKRTTMRDLPEEDVEKVASQMVCVVEVSPERAVPWTKPDDLPYDPAQPTRGLENLRSGGFLAMMADVSALGSPGGTRTPSASERTTSR